MFDGTGMNDSVFQAGNQAGQYQTYKLALYIYASKVLGYPVNETTEADMLRMQGASGGFPTGYDSNFSNDGTNTNVETTSLAILALLPTPPTRTPSPPPSPQSPTPRYPNADTHPTDNYRSFRSISGRCLSRKFAGLLQKT